MRIHTLEAEACPSTKEGRFLSRLEVDELARAGTCWPTLAGAVAEAGTGTEKLLSLVPEHEAGSRRSVHPGAIFLSLHSEPIAKSDFTSRRQTPSASGNDSARPQAQPRKRGLLNSWRPEAAADLLSAV